MAPTTAPNGTYTFLKEKDELATLVDKYDNFLFGTCLG